MFYYHYRWSRIMYYYYYPPCVSIILFSLLSCVITCAITGLCLRQPYQHLFFLPRSVRRRVIIKCIIIILFYINKKKQRIIDVAGRCKI